MPKRDPKLKLPPDFEEAVRRVLMAGPMPKPKPRKRQKRGKSQKAR